jgi:integrase
MESGAREYRVKTVVLSSGERLPMLLGSDGSPLFEPTVYSLVELRARNRAANTIEACLRSLILFYVFLDLRCIDLPERLKHGTLLSLSEIEDLAGFSRLPLESITNMRNEENSEAELLGVVSLEKHRMRLTAKRKNEEVLPLTAANRLRAIRDFLAWLSIQRSSKHGLPDSFRAGLETTRQTVCSAIDARLPSGRNYDPIGKREGLEPAAVGRMLQVVEPHSKNNPWKGDHSKHRNALIIHWLYSLGLRRGELLGVRISDIDFKKGTVIVARRADDPSDPRRFQPNAKTRAREIPLSPGLLDMTRNYIIEHRATLPGARKHNFLFVSTNAGAPLSIPAVNKIFNILKMKCPDLPRELCPHVLRHTWNDRFSEEMDKNQVAEETEKKTRSYLMGWSETSGTAATYTRRHIRKKAQKVSLAMQKSMMEEGSHDE